MHIINDDWTKTRLTDRHGEMAELAPAMGIDSDKISKIIRGERRVQPEEIPGALRFFNETLTGEEGTATKIAISKLVKLSPKQLQEALRYLDYLESLTEDGPDG